MRMVTTNISNDEWPTFTRWCRKLSIKYTVIYDYGDAILVKVPAWFLMQWIQDELDEEKL